LTGLGWCHLISTHSSAIFIINPALGAELLLKNPIFLGLAVIICISLQIWISYVSACSILDGDLIVGLSLFLLVPLLGVLMVLYFLWFRRQKASLSSKE
jgi:hypothetical protein